MLTRLEVFRASRGVKMADLVAESGYHRSHVFRIRHATTEPSRDAIAAIVSAMRRLTLENVRPEMLFELSMEESGAWRKDFAKQLTRELAAYRRERRRTAAILAELAKLPRTAWTSALARIGGMSAALARAAAIEGRRLLNGNPSEADALFELSATVADRARDITAPDYRSFLAGRARLERANALRHLGAFDAALGLLDDAEKQFAGVAMCSHELGRTWFARGSILFKMNGLDAAERWLRLAVNIFAATSDQRRISLVRVVEANVVFERGDWSGAHDLWVTNLPTLEASRDRHALASVWLNLGWCDTERGQPDTAKAWLDRAMIEFTKMSSRTDIARTRWALAVIEARHDRRGPGILALRSVREEFESMEMFTDVGMVDLDLVEIQLLQPYMVADAVATCGRLVTLFLRAGAQKEAMKALAYLHEAVRSGAATPKLARHIRQEMKAAARDREYRFDASAID